MHPAGRDQSEQMERAPGALDMRETFLQHRIACKCAVVDCVVDPGDALQNDAPGTKVQMANLTIALLSFR